MLQRDKERPSVYAASLTAVSPAVARCWQPGAFRGVSFASAGFFSNKTDICQPDALGNNGLPDDETCAPHMEKENRMVLLIMFLGQALLGIGVVPIQPFGISYIDDFASERNSPLYLGRTKNESQQSKRGNQQGPRGEGSAQQEVCKNRSLDFKCIYFYLRQTNSSKCWKFLELSLKGINAEENWFLGVFVHFISTSHERASWCKMKERQ